MVRVQGTKEVRVDKVHSIIPDPSKEVNISTHYSLRARAITRMYENSVPENIKRRSLDTSV